MPWLESVFVRMRDSSIGVKKLGQPLPESNLVPDLGERLARTAGVLEAELRVTLAERQS
jgi:hypothetical protein